jgi:mono/diheme cytochrome c family protein
VASRAGCLACHLFGSEGNRGPGSDLTRVGARLSRAQIRRALRRPKAPMPSYSMLPRSDFAALVAYLAALR